MVAVTEGSDERSQLLLPALLPQVNRNYALPLLYRSICTESTLELG